MTSFLEYLLYVAAFTAFVLAFEGVSRLVRANVGEQRAIALRLQKARSAAVQSKGQKARKRFLDSADAYFPRLKIALTRANAPFSPTQFLAGGAALFALLLVLFNLLAMPRPMAAVAAGILAIAIPYLAIKVMMAKRRKKFLEQLPHAIDLMARSLQAGHPTTTAMNVVGERMPAPLGPEFRVVTEEMTYGLERGEALANLIERFPLPELRMFSASLDVTRETGGNLAEVFLKLAEAIRAKDTLRRKVQAISAEGKMTFWVVTGLPFAVAAFIMFTRPAFFTEVSTDTLFWPMISYAPITLTIGAIIIWRMVNLKI